MVPGTKSQGYFQETLHVQNRKICVVGNCINELPTELTRTELRREFGLDDDTIVILYLGRLIKRKGLHLLISAFGRLACDVSNVKLVVCGEGPEYAKDRSLQRELGISSDVIEWVGRVDSAKVWRYYFSSDIYVLPSYFLGGEVEAWGLSINEAVYYHVPVITTDAVGAAVDVLNNGKYGAIVPENNVDGLYTKLNEYCMDLTSVKQRAEEAFVYYSSHFLTSVVSEKICKSFVKLILNNA